jgi:quercetin dioxygenase-like cupin family protein
LEFRVINAPENNTNHPGRAHDARTRIAMTGDDSDGRFALFELNLRKGDEPPMHLHTREDELLFVLDGLIEISLDGACFRLGAGASIFLPRGSEHAYALHSETARLLLVATPAGVEGFHRDLADADPGDGYVERLIVTAARYGIVITGPGIGEDAT